MNARKMERRVRMGWRRHILECRVSITEPLAPYGRPRERAVCADVFWAKLGVGSAYAEPLRDGDTLPAVRAAERVLQRVLARARIEHPYAKLVPVKYEFGRFEFEVVCGPA